MKNKKLLATLACALSVIVTGQSLAGDGGGNRAENRGAKLPWGDSNTWFLKREFRRVATLANYINNDDRDAETVSEIVAASKNGRTLVYTDSEIEEIGFVWIGDPANPIPTGKVGLPGEPTSVAVLGNTLALVAVDTSESLTNTSGKLVVVRVNNRDVIAELELGGQPDSIAISPDERYAAVAIENERDEEICVGGTANGEPVPEDDEVAEEACESGGGVIGGLPQTEFGNPPGSLAIVDLKGGNPANWTVRQADLTGLAAYAPGDPEPEFVDIDENNIAVVSLQENNHIALVDLESGQVVGGFDAGTVDLVGIDATEDDMISLTENLDDVPREPDAIAWVDGLIGTANEGDLFGGSRGFSLFNRTGQLVYDSGAAYEELAVRYGHYPEGRSENKGSEPEAIEYGEFGRDKLIFVASERGSFVGVYELRRWGPPRLKQFLPGPLGPEGVLAIPKRNLLVVSSEEDDPEFGVRSSIMIYEYGFRRSNVARIASRDLNGKPIPFSALSGMDALPNGQLVAVWDSFYADSRIFMINPWGRQAKVTHSFEITGADNLDPEGIAVAPDGSGYWVASEGNRTGSRLNRLLHVDQGGAVMQEIFLPDEIEACRAAERDLGEDENGDPIGNIGSHNGGFEGVAVLPTRHGYKLLVAQQRGWDYTTSAECEALDDDPDGSNPSEPAYTRIWIYDPEAGTWDHVAWELAPVPENASWAGLSEITAAGDGDYVVIERDNRTGDFAELKTLVLVNRMDGRDGVSAADKTVVDIIPALEANNGWITDKPEGVAITRFGQVYLVTDNDGVDDWSGETWFIRLGNVRRLFGK